MTRFFAGWAMASTPMPMNNPSIAIHFGRIALDSADIDPDERDLISGFFKCIWLIDVLAAMVVMHYAPLLRAGEYERAILIMMDWATETDFFHGELSQQIRRKFMAIMVMTATHILQEQDAIARN